MSIAARSSRDARTTRAPILGTPLEGPPPDFVSQNGDPMSAEDGSRWMVNEAAHYRAKGATWVRLSIHPDIENLRLVEAWLERPETEGKPQWALTLVRPSDAEQLLEPGRAGYCLLQRGEVAKPDAQPLGSNEMRLHPAPAKNSAHDNTGSERSEHRDAQTNTSLHSEEKEERR